MNIHVSPISDTVDIPVNIVLQGLTKTDGVLALNEGTKGKREIIILIRIDANPRNTSSDR